MREGNGSNHDDKPRINHDRLPANCQLRLAEHPNPRIEEALGHLKRRGVLREMHRKEPPCSAIDISAADPLRSESISTIKYHLKVLVDCGVIEQSGELVTPTGYQPLFVSGVADDDLVLWVLREMGTEDHAAAPGPRR